MVHLWIHDLDTDETARLTEGAFTVANPDWSPDSRRITFERRPNPSANDRWQSDIWLVESATGVTRQLYENGGSDTGPEWSPDGRTIAYASNRVSGSNTLHNNLHLISSEGGEPRVLLDDIDRDFSNPIWAMDGRHVYWSIRIWNIDAAVLGERRIRGERSFSDPRDGGWHGDTGVRVPLNLARPASIAQVWNRRSLRWCRRWGDTTRSQGGPAFPCRPASAPAGDRRTPPTLRQ